MRAVWLSPRRSMVANLKGATRQAACLTMPIIICKWTTPGARHCCGMSKSWTDDQAIIMVFA